MFDAVPNDSTGYVFAAYMVFLVLLLIYVGILGMKFQRINRDLSELADEIEAGQRGTASPPTGEREAAEPGASADPGGSSA